MRSRVYDLPACCYSYQRLCPNARITTDTSTSTSTTSTTRATTIHQHSYYCLLDMLEHL